MATRFFGTALRHALLSGFLSLLVSSCGDSAKEEISGGTCESSQKAVASASFNELWTNVFSSQCGACHGAGTDTKTAGGPDLRTKEGFYNGLVGKKGGDYADWDTFQKNRESCLPYDFIKAGSANSSLVTAVLDNTVSLPGCTIAYHRDAPQSVCITATNLTKLKEWINAGAAL